MDNQQKKDKAAKKITALSFTKKGEKKEKISDK